MNNDRRAALKAATAELAKLAQQMAEQRAAIEAVKDEEAEALEAMPEGLKSGDRGQEMEAAISLMDEALDKLDCLDLAAVSELLGDAADREMAELPAAKLSAAEVMERARARLPAWAKQELERAAAELASTQAKAREVYPEPGPDSFVVEDHFSPHKGRALPFERITLRGITIEAEEHREGITLHAGGGRGGLVVVPHVSNTLSIELRKYR